MVNYPIFAMRAIEAAIVPPVPAVPLTDKQIDAILDASNVTEIDAVPIEYDREIARAIERAHGIGEKP